MSCNCGTISPVATSLNTVVLANGVVLDLNQIGRLVAKQCPGLVSSVPVSVVTQVAQPVQAVQTTPVTQITLDQQTQQLQQQLQQLATMNMMGGLAAQEAFRFNFDLNDGISPGQVMLGQMMAGLY